MTKSENRWPLSATQWIFGREDLTVTADRLARLGYDGVELLGEPEQFTVETVRAVVEPRDLRVTSICGIFTPERDLSHPSAEVRAGGIRYLKACAELGAALGAGVVIVVPTAVGRVKPEADPASEWRWAVESIREAATAVEGLGIRFVVEALNRYETYLVNTVEAAAQLAAEVYRSNVGIMADLFHMNIEEDDIPARILALGEVVRHVHFADSNRRAPGLGHTDFRRVIEALNTIHYQGALTMEFLPRTANPYLAASLDVPESEKAANSAQAIAHIRGILADGSVTEGRR